jgi:hypothetical protein
MLDGAARTAPLKGEYANSSKVKETTATCALGAARYSYAMQNGIDNFLFRYDSELRKVEEEIASQYGLVYNERIVDSNDEHGREKVVSQVKEMLNG